MPPDFFVAPFPPLLSFLWKQILEKFLGHLGSLTG